jgi:kanamycin kinase
VTRIPDFPAHPLGARPTALIDVPAAVARLAGTADLEPVWANAVGGLTFRWGERYVKWVPAAAPVDLADEAARLVWAAPWISVPEVLDHGADEDGAWLVTRALPGRSAVDPHWLERPAAAARGIGAGLRALHDALPVADCPFDWGVAARTGDVHLLEAAPAVDLLVVCHGDACVPNTLLGDDGTLVAHVDLGSLGTADRWADLAIAAWSTEWNYGPGFADLVYEAYGVEPDVERIAFYRALWDAT